MTWYAIITLTTRPTMQTINWLQPTLINWITIVVYFFITNFMSFMATVSLSWHTPINSRTSQSGHSKKWTHSLQWTKFQSRIDENPIPIIKLATSEKRTPSEERIRATVPKCPLFGGWLYPWRHYFAMFYVRTGWVKQFQKILLMVLPEDRSS